MKSNLFGKLTSSVHILNCVMKEKDNDSYKKTQSYIQRKVFNSRKRKPIDLPPTGCTRGTFEFQFLTHQFLSRLICSVKTVRENRVLFQRDLRAICRGGDIAKDLEVAAIWA